MKKAVTICLSAVLLTLVILKFDVILTALLPSGVIPYVETRSACMEYSFEDGSSFRISWRKPFIGSGEFNLISSDGLKVRGTCAKRPDKILKCTISIAMEYSKDVRSMIDGSIFRKHFFPEEIEDDGNYTRPEPAQGR